MISSTSIYLSFIDQSKTYYVSSSSQQLPKGGFYVVLKSKQSSAIAFEMEDQDKVTGSFRLKTSQYDTLQPLYLSVEPVSPNTLFLSPTKPQAIRYRWSNKKLQCIIQHETQTNSQSSTPSFQILGEIYAGKQTKEGTMIVVNSAQQFIFKKIKENNYIIGTYAEAFKSMFYVSFMNEIPNYDVIPGSTYFRVNIHRNIKHAVHFEFIKGTIGYKMKVIEKKSPTVKYLYNPWFIKLRKINFTNEFVYCDENEADEFVFTGGRIEIVENEKCINYIGIGNKRDDESYFLSIYPLELLKLSLDVKIVTILDDD